MQSCKAVVDIMTKDSSLWNMTPCCLLFLNILKGDNTFIFRVMHKEYFDCLAPGDEGTVSLTMSAPTHLTTATTHLTTQELHT
jgi:hypothetical protein